MRAKLWLMSDAREDNVNKEISKKQVTRKKCGKPVKRRDIGEKTLFRHRLLGKKLQPRFFRSLLIGRNRHNRSGPFFSGLHQGEDEHQEGKNFLRRKVTVIDPEMGIPIANRYKGVLRFFR